MERRTQQRRIKKRRLQQYEKLTTSLLVKLSIWALSIIIIASALTFYVTYGNARERIISVLQQDIQPTLERNEALFDRIENNADILAASFLSQYQLTTSNPYFVAQFDRWFAETSPGVVRLKPEFNNGTTDDRRDFRHLSAFLGPRDAPIDAELKARVMAAVYVLDELGPAWQNDVTNTHFSMPENSLLMYSTEAPWGLLADKDLVITDFSVVKSTLMAENPQREPNWTGLYYDISADVWTVTYQRPVDLGERHLANASFDVALDNLIGDLTARKRAKAEHIVLKENGDLIAASNLAQDTIQERSTVTSQNYPEPLYQQLSQFVASHTASNTPTVIEDAVDGQLLIIDQLEGVDWWHITAYPLAEIRRQAIILPLQLIGAGIGLIVLVLLMSYWLIRREVSRPLQEVAKVASLMGQRHYHEALAHRSEAIKARGEVKRALDAFQTMASRFIVAQDELEQEVESRTAELANANKQLNALAHMDGLTGLFNRRAFDRDLAAACQASDSLYLMMADIDDFKAYNDNYGHEAGDKALQLIAGCLLDETPLKIYRYGGEELAMIIPHDDKVEGKLNELREAVAAMAVTHEYASTGLAILTLSIGVAPIVTGDSPADAIRRADKQLYQAKENGRNRVCME